MDSTITFEETIQGEWGILSAHGRLDTKTASALEKAGLAVLARHARMAIDMSGIHYLSSAGIRSLMRLAKKARMGKKKFVLCSVPTNIKDVLNDSGANIMFTLYESTAEFVEQ